MPSILIRLDDDLDNAILFEMAEKTSKKSKAEFIEEKLRGFYNLNGQMGV